MSERPIDSGYETHGQLIFFWRIDPDFDPQNPLDDDEMGEILSLNRRHSNYDADRIEAELDRDDGQPSDAVPLSYFEHGLCRWSVASPSDQQRPDWQWDGVSFAGIWLPDQGLLAYIEGVSGKERRAKLVEWAGQACEAYTQWCNGDVYGYTVEAFALKVDEDGEPLTDRDDYDDEILLYDDACWGFFGLAAVRDEISMVIEHAKDTELPFIDPAMA